jgi:drug/metabolite transporter (DMT)-like permease
MMFPKVPVVPRKYVICDPFVLVVICPWAHSTPFRSGPACLHPSVHGLSGLCALKTPHLSKEMAAGAALVAAESILALTPVVIKKTPLDPISAIWSRILSSAALGYWISGDRELQRKEWAGAGMLGYFNLLHVATSYESFRHLPAGQAMSLLYTYPMWNLVLGSVFGGETINPKEWMYMGLALVGSLFLNMGPGAPAEAALVRKPVPWWGVFMGLVMAITESAMHTTLKKLNWLDPAKSVWVVNSSASVWLAGFLGLQTLVSGVDAPGFTNHSATWWDAAALTAFHSVSMFSGYWLRFFAVPRLSVVNYSILSYAGLLAAYLFGFLFLGERPGWMSLLGAALILVAGLLLQTLPKENERKDR